MVLMFLVSKERTRGLWYLHIFKLFVLVYTSCHPSKTECLSFFALENVDDLGKSFCVIMCYTVTAIKNTKDTIKMANDIILGQFNVKY